MSVKIARELLVRPGQGNRSAWIRVRYHEIDNLKAENSRLKAELNSCEINRHYYLYGVLYMTLKRLDYDFLDISSAIYNMNKITEMYPMSDIVDLGMKVFKSQK